jgi:acyl carrier protein
MKFTKTEDLLAKFFVEREGEGILSSIRTIDFVSSGVIDSLDLISLAVYIEKNFGVKIDLTQKETLDSIRRFDSLVALIQDL